MILRGKHNTDIIGNIIRLSPGIWYNTYVAYVWNLGQIPSTRVEYYSTGIVYLKRGDRFKYLVKGNARG